MKSWADCSSDEEEDDYSVEIPDEEDNDLVAETSNKLQVKEGIPHDAVDKDEPRQQHPRTYDYPDRPPFTAFVGNLSYDIHEALHLQRALVDVVQDRLGERIQTIGGQISYDRSGDNKQHRGFGYVEFENLEELKLVMKLNDDSGALLAGRKVHVNTANNRSNHRGSQHNSPSNRGSFNNGKSSDIDGSKFQGGKYSNKNNHNNTINSRRKNSFPSNPSHNDTQNDHNERGSFSLKQDGVKIEPKRPSLILAPRSKPIARSKSREASSSNIFGGAKARDESAWEINRRASQQEEQQQTQKVKDQTTTVTANSKDAENGQTKDDRKACDEVVEDDDNSTGKDVVRKKDNKNDNDWKSVDPSSANNKAKNGKKTSAAHPNEKRPNGRGGRGGKTRGSRGSNSGRLNHGNKVDDTNRKKGSGRRKSQQQDTKQKGRRQQSSREEKAAPDKNNKVSSKNLGAAVTVSQASLKKETKAPSNTFALLMDSDSE